MIDRMVSDDENEHISNLAKLRDRLIEERRAQVAATVGANAEGNVSESDFLKIRELQARIEEVKEMLKQEKGSAFRITQQAESEVRAREVQARFDARWGKLGS